MVRKTAARISQQSVFNREPRTALESNLRRQLSGAKCRETTARPFQGIPSFGERRSACHKRDPNGGATQTIPRRQLMQRCKTSAGRILEVRLDGGGAASGRRNRFPSQNQPRDRFNKGNWAGLKFQVRKHLSRLVLLEEFADQTRSAICALFEPLRLFFSFGGMGVGRWTTMATAGRLGLRTRRAVKDLRAMKSRPQAQKQSQEANKRRL